MRHTKCAIFIALMYTTSGVALAQTAPATEAAKDAGADEANQEIVVTATRREASLQDVPLSVSAISAQTLSSSGVADVRQLTNVVPGLVGSRQNAAFLPTIRGVGSAGVSRNDESNIGVYVDGVYQPDAASNMIALANIQRVEVLRGPQGTIFGRNATGGLINIITPLPSKDSKVKGSVSYGRFYGTDALGAQGYATTGLGGDSAIDLSAVYRSNGAYIDDLQSKRKIGKAYMYDFRSRILLQPSSAFQVIGTVEYGYTDDPTGNIFQPYNNQTQGRSVVGTVLPTRLFQTSVDVASVSTVKRWSASLQLSYDFGPVRGESTSAWNWSSLTQGADTDSSPIKLSGSNSFPRSNTLSQEFRLLSSNSSPFEWILGAYAFRQHGSVAVTTYSATANTALLSTARTEAYAGFAEGTYSITDAFKITAGTRYSTEDRTFTNYTNTVLRVNNAKVSANQWTYRGSLQYRFSPAANTYLTYSTGFKSGVFNTLSNNPNPTRPEQIKSWEGGLKTNPASWLRANISVFHYDYTDLQVQARDPLSGTFVLQNAASAKIKGGELEINAQPIHDLSLRGAISILDAKYSAFPLAQVFIPQANGGNQAQVRDVSGNTLVRAPKLLIQTGFDWQHEYTAGTAGLGVNLLHSTRVYYDFLNSVSQKPYTTINGELSFRPAQTPWKLGLSVTNLTDNRVAQQITPGTFGTYVSYEKPRTVMLTASYGF